MFLSLLVNHPGYFVFQECAVLSYSSHLCRCRNVFILESDVNSRLMLSSPESFPCYLYISSFFTVDYTGRLLSCSFSEDLLTSCFLGPTTLIFHLVFLPHWCIWIFYIFCDSQTMLFFEVTGNSYYGSTDTYRSLVNVCWSKGATFLLLLGATDWH